MLIDSWIQIIDSLISVVIDIDITWLILLTLKGSLMIKSKLRLLGDSLIWTFVNAVATDVTCSTRIHEVVQLRLHQMLRNSPSISLLRKKDTTLEAILHIRLRHHELRLHHLRLIRIRIHEHLGRRRVWIHVHRRLWVHLLWRLLEVIVWRALVRGT